MQLRYKCDPVASYIEGESEDGLYSGLTGFQNGVALVLHIAILFSSGASRIQRCTFW